MKILFAASEAAPFVKTGGLGDVAYALPDELSKMEDVEICVFLPYYKSLKEQGEFVTSFCVPLAWRSVHVGLFKAPPKKATRGRKKEQNVTYYFIDNEYYFGRDRCYGDMDDGERFAYFSKAILESLPHIGFFPDIIHCNDWQTSLIPLFLKAEYNKEQAYQSIRTVFTIHNIEYQGKTSHTFLQDVMGLSEDWRAVVTHKDCINFMKSAIVLADKITTVSKTYSYEIQHAYFAHGLESILQQNAYKVSGVVNGIDPVSNNPAKNENLTVPYKAGEVEKKAENKLWLQQKLELPVDGNIPMIGMISRLVEHKGLSLVEFVSERIASLDMQLVVIGTGDTRYQDLFNYLAYAHPDKVSAHITFDPILADQLYAASDLFLMPSKSEPCGLSQLIAMRYGSIPIVRETGGLVDTVPPLDIQTLEGCGFTFKSYNADDMLNAIERGIAFYHDGDKRRQVVRNIMKRDSSWKQPAKEYYNIYQSVIVK